MSAPTPTTTRRTVALVLALVVGLALGWYLFADRVPAEVASRELVSVERDTVRDTVRVALPPDTIRIHTARTRIVYDTTAPAVPVRAFIATLDTVTAQGDTVRATVAYTPPQAPTLAVLILRKPDTVAVETLHTREVFTVETVKSAPARPWFVDALVVVGAGAVGYTVGRLAP